jgi:outer membrane murein-binding lipoprotein Lpp
MISLSRSRLRLSKTLVAALISGACVLAGCSGGSIVADHLPTAVGGLPEGAPQRPTTTSAYPAVHDMPPSRPTTVLTDAEQTKLESDLVAARNRAAEAAKSAAAADKP